MNIDITEHSTLYRKSASTGKILQWRTWTEGNNIHTEWGATGEKLQRTFDTIKSGKSPGRKNATTPVTQAQKDCLGLWSKKLKGGYVLTPEAAEADETADVITGGIWPMLAHVFKKHGSKIKWPAMLQPKLNGHRCIAMFKAGKVTLWSRKRNQIVSLPHIIKELERVCPESFKDRDFNLDGELYNHELREQFGRLTSMIKRDKVKPESAAMIQYHMYDIDDSADRSTYALTRQAALSAFCRGKRFNASTILKRVETTVVNDEQEAIDLFEEYIALGYEGAMVRNTDTTYESKGPSGRSYGLQKIKEFDDTEFEIVGVVEGNGKLMGHGIFVCACNGNTFECKMKGKDRGADLRDYWENPDKYIGRQLTVQHQGYTDKSIVPLFPVGLQLRNDL